MVICYAIGSLFKKTYTEKLIVLWTLLRTHRLAQTLEKLSQRR